MMRPIVKSLLIGVIVAGAISSGIGARAQNEQDWVSVALDHNGRWAWQFDPNRDAAERRALNRCGSACESVFTERARCVAYAESRSGGYHYSATHGSSHEEANTEALTNCARVAPANTCRLVKSHCQGEP